jgi:hypothetical protein
LKNLSSLIFGVQLLTTLLTLVMTGYTLSQVRFLAPTPKNSLDLSGFRRTNQIDNAPQLRLFFSYAVLDFRLPKRRHTPPGEYHNDSIVFSIWL